MKKAVMALALAFFLAPASHAGTKKEVNILWVVDNSGSGAGRYLPRKLKEGFVHFSKILKTPYTMSVVTTDYFNDAGALVTSPSGLRVVSSQSKDPIGDFAALVDSIQDSPTSFWEQGLESAYAALNAPHPQFLTPGAKLYVIYVSDEDDYSCADHCSGVQPEDNADWVQYPTARYRKQLAALGASSFALVGTPDSSCKVASIGYRYATVQPTGGIGFGSSICEPEIVKSLIEFAIAIQAHN